MSTLHHFRSSLGLNLLYNLIHGRIQCSAMLKKVYIYVPAVSTRKKTVFGIPSAKTDYKQRCWHYHLLYICNHFNLNPFQTFSQWKIAVHRALSLDPL